MGQMIDEEDCEVCKPFDQEWIFTYGDLVTLLFCFFVLLVSLCKTDVEKIKQISASFKENPPGSPFVFTGQSSNLDKAAQQLEKLDVPDDVEINASDKGVEVTFRLNRVINKFMQIWLYSISNINNVTWRYCHIVRLSKFT